MDSTGKIIVDYTEEENEYLLGKLRELYDIVNINHARIPDEYSEIIDKAAKSSDKKVSSFACAVVFTGVRDLITKLLPDCVKARTPYGTQKSWNNETMSDDMDYYNEAYIKITEVLDKYDSSKGVKVVTFLDPHLRSGFNNVTKRNNGDGRTNHETAHTNLIKRVEEEYRKKYNRIPTNKEVADIINRERKDRKNGSDDYRTISERQVGKYRKGNITQISIVQHDKESDSMKEMDIEDRYHGDVNPVEVMLKKDKQDEFYKVVEGCSPNSRMVIRVMLDHIQDSDGMIKDSELAKELTKINVTRMKMLGPDIGEFNEKEYVVTEKKAKEYRLTAENELRHNYNVRKRRERNIGRAGSVTNYQNVNNDIEAEMIVLEESISGSDLFDIVEDIPVWD